MRARGSSAGRRWQQRTRTTRIAEPYFSPGWAGPLLAVLIGFWETRHAWGRRLPAGSDIMALLIRTRFGLGQVLSKGHLDGWLPNFALGYQEFLFYGPGMTFFIGLVRVGTLGLLSDAGALKVVTIGSFCLFPLTVAWLARSMGLSRQGAGIAAILSLVVDNPFGVGLQALFENSLIAQQLAACLVFIVLGGILRTLVEPRRRITVLTGTALALLMVTHIISTVILALLILVSVPAALFTDRPARGAGRELGICALIGVGGAGFWLLPAVAHRNLEGVIATWSTPSLPSRLEDIWRGTYLFPPHVAELLAAAWLYQLWRVAQRKSRSVSVLALPIGYVLVCRFMLHRYGAGDSLVSNFSIEIENRGIGMAAVIAVFPLAELGADLVRRLGAVGNVVAVLAASWLAVTTLGPNAAMAAQVPVPPQAMVLAAQELHRIVPRGARFAEVRQYPQDQIASGLVHPDYWLEYTSGRWGLNEFNPESSSTPDAAFLPENLFDATPSADGVALARDGVAYVISLVPASTTVLEQAPSLRPVWSDGSITILRVAAPPGQPTPASLVSTTSSSPATASMIEAGSQHLVIEVHGGRSSVATVAVAWSPKWHARINGHPLKVGRSADGLIQLQLPAGSSRLSLTFSDDDWDRLGFTLSVVTLAALVLPWASRVRSRRRSRLVRGLRRWSQGLRSPRPAG